MHINMDVVQTCLRRRREILKWGSYPLVCWTVSLRSRKNFFNSHLIDVNAYMLINDDNPQVLA